MPRGEFKLARHIGGRGHYGWVVVDVEPAGTSTEVVLASAAEIYGNGQGLVPAQAHDWVTAVLQGCWDGVEYARQHGMTEPYHVQVLRIDGLHVDTLDEHLRIAATAAVLRAVPTGLRSVGVGLEHGCWVIRTD